MDRIGNLGEDAALARPGDCVRRRVERGSAAGGEDIILAVEAHHGGGIVDEGHSEDGHADGRHLRTLRCARLRGRLRRCSALLVEQGDQALEAFGARCFVGCVGGGVFAGAHEAVARAIVDDRVVFFAGGLHGVRGGGNGGGDAGVVASVEAVDGRGDGGDIGGRRAVEDEGGGEIAAVGGEVEGLATAPAEACDEELAVGRGQPLAVVGGGVEVGGDDGGIERGDGLGDGVLAGEGVGASTIGAEAAEQVGRDDDEALSGELVSHLLGPVAEAEDLVDHEDDRGLLADLGIDDEGLHGAIAVVDGDVLAVARRLFQRRLGPVLRDQRRSGEGEEQDEGEREQDGAAHGVSLAEGDRLRQGDVNGYVMRPPFFVCEKYQSLQKRHVKSGLFWIESGLSLD